MDHAQLIKKVLLAFVVVFSLVLGEANSFANSAESGNQWLAMSDMNRELLVEQFISGYNLAAYQVCDSFEYKFRPDSSEIRAESERSNKTPSEICAQLAYHFTRINRENSAQRYQAYVSTITTFYRKNPTYRSIPLIAILLRLADGGDVTADQLLQAVLSRKMKPS